MKSSQVYNKKKKEKKKKKKKKKRNGIRPQLKASCGFDPCVGKVSTGMDKFNCKYECCNFCHKNNY